MIDCREVATRLMDYAMDDLSAPARAEVEAHLDACPPCRQLVDEYRAVSELVAEAMELPLTAAEQEALDQAVLEAIARSA